MLYLFSGEGVDATSFAAPEHARRSFQDEEAVAVHNHKALGEKTNTKSSPPWGSHDGLGSPGTLQPTPHAHPALLRRPFDLG